MGYFSNGTEGMQYEERWCAKCVHNHEEHGCPVWNAHLLWNYDECNNDESILHKMIPTTGGGYNGQFAGKCNFFRENDK